jgi:hypothetical protein
VLSQPRRRWAFFPRSVISDHENPSAHLYRAMAKHVAQLDDEARFYEERANPWLRGMLSAQGAEAFRSFPDRHPEVTYVTYERRTGHQLAEWLSLALATVDIVVVDTQAPKTIVEWIGELTRPQLHTFLFDPDGTLPQLTEPPEFMQWYRGVCTSSQETEHLALAAHQYLIPFGPGLPKLGHNGSATKHVDTTAEHLVVQMAKAVDQTLTSDPGNVSSEDRRHDDASN